MKLPSASSTFEPCPTGTHLALCISVVDLGTHEQEFQGKVTTPRQLMITWELPDEPMDDGNPYTISKWYNFSMNEMSNLRKDLEAWRGRPFTAANIGPDGDFEIDVLLGKCCLINVVDKPNGNGTKAGSIMPVTKGTVVPPNHNPLTLFDLNDFDADVFNSLSEYQQETIRKSPEFLALSGERPKAIAIGKADLSDDNDVPF